MAEKPPKNPKEYRELLDRFLKSHIEQGWTIRQRTKIPNLKTDMGSDVGMGMAVTHYDSRERNVISPQHEAKWHAPKLFSWGGGESNRFREIPIHSKHLVFTLPGARTSKGGQIAMKVFLPGDAQFGPEFARIESDNLLLARNLGFPYVRHIRSDVGYNNKFGRLFTEIPEGYVALHRIDMGKLSKKTRTNLLRALARTAGFFHRRRGVHGDMHFGNILINMGLLEKEPEHHKIIKFLDAETFNMAEPIPKADTLQHSFFRDTSTMLTDAVYRNLIKPQDKERIVNEVLHPEYMSMWTNSRIEDDVARHEPGMIFRRMFTDDDVEEQPHKGIRQSMREKLLRRAGLSKD